MSEMLRDVVARQRALERRLAALERLETPADRAAAWGRAVGMLQMFPGVVGIWPMSAGYGGAAADVSGNNRQLTGVGSIQYSAAADGLCPYCDFDGSTGYLYRADESPLDIVGTESWIAAAIKGLTMGAWVYFDDDADGVNHEYVLAKANLTSTALRAYELRRESTTGRIQAVVGNGTSLTAQLSTAVAGAGQWLFLAMRYDPGAELRVWFNGDSSVNTTSIPASLVNSSAQLTIGSADSGLSKIDGRISLAFLCAAAVPDIFIETFYHLTAPLFGVGV